jgi:S1-C subfamily serine protease
LIDINIPACLEIYDELAAVDDALSNFSWEEGMQLLFLRMIRHCVVIVCYSFLTVSTAGAASCDKSFSEVFREVSPSTVRILSVAIDPFKVMERVQLGVGTGFVIDADGHIVTSAHVVYGASEVIASNGKEQMAKAEIVGVDPVSDLAVLRLTAPDVHLQSARLGTSKTLAIGDEVLAIGYPLGIGKTATRGIISGIERVVPLSTFSWMTPFIQTDAAISPGNSGGPLVNRCSEIIGVNTLRAEGGQNINFAIPIDLVRELVPEMIEKGRVIRPWHGINGQIAPRELVFTLGLVPGFLVETIEPGSPAEKINLHGGTFRLVIGVQEYLLGGDVITKVNGEPLTDMETVARIARSLRVGDNVKLEYWRRGELHTTEVVLPERPVLPGDVMRFHERRSPR